MGGNYDRGIIIFTLIMFNILFTTLVTVYGNSVYANVDKPMNTTSPETGFVVDTGIRASGLDSENTNIVQYFFTGLTNVPVWLNAILLGLFIFTVIVIISLLRGG